MADVNYRESRCSVCGARIRTRIPDSFNFTDNEEDLDFRPGEPKRNQYRGWIHSCPRCNHVARKPEDPAKVSERFLKAESYQTCDGIHFRDKKAIQYYRFYLIAKENGNLKDQLFGIQGACWACDDAGDSENAQVCRRIGIEVLDQLLEQDEDEYDQMIRMDFLRRCGQFHELQQQYQDVRFNDEKAERARRFHLERANANDTACYSMKELDQYGPWQEQGEFTVLLSEEPEENQEKTVILGKKSSEPQIQKYVLKPVEESHREPLAQRQRYTAPQRNRELNEDRTETEYFSWEEQEAMLEGLNTPQQQSDPQTAEKKANASGGSSSGKKAVIAAVIVVVLLVGGFLLGKMIAGGLSDQEEQTASEENKDFTAVDADHITLLSSDWDWDSKQEDDLNEEKQVYAILLVENKDESPISKIEFNVEDKFGDDIKDVEHPDQTLSAEGYVKAGQKGIMVADIHLDKDAYQPDPDCRDYEITAAYINPDIDEDYEVPIGTVLDPIDNIYDVEVSNLNENDVNQNALLVAVKVRDDRIKASDATGKLTAPLPGKTPNVIAQRAYKDPEFRTDIEDLTVYVIDRDYYRDVD